MIDDDLLGFGNVSQQRHSRGQRSMKRPSGPDPTAIHLNPRERAILQEIVRCRHSPQYEVLRARIILEADRGQGNQRIGEALDISRETVRLWRTRWANAAERLKEMVPVPNDKDLRIAIRSVLHDAPRSGTPPTFTAEQVCQIVAVACESVGDSGRPVAQWTHRELADEVVQRGIVRWISSRTVGRFLKGGRSQTSQDPILAEQRKREGSRDI